MKFAIPLFVFALSLFTSMSWGETVTLKQHNCAVELPEGWIQRPKTGEPDRFILEAKSAGGDRQVSVMLDTLPMKGQEAIDAYLTAIGKLNASQGWRNSKPVIKTIGGRSFTFITYGPEDQPHRVMFMAFTGVGGSIYNVSGFKKGGDASKDAELLGILESFRFLSAAK